MKTFHILAVDDDPHQLALLRRILRQSQFLVETAGSGRAALRMAIKAPPDLVLLDVSMSGMSGMEFLRRLRRLETRGLVKGHRGSPPQGGHRMPIPVIFLAASPAPQDRLDAGAPDYVTKPFSAEELLARIRTQPRLAPRHRPERDCMTGVPRH